MTMVYAGQREIQGYIRWCAEKYQLLDHLRLGPWVEAARYDEAAGRWRLELAGGGTASHRLLVSATGVDRGTPTPHFRPAGRRHRTVQRGGSARRFRPSCST